MSEVQITARTLLRRAAIHEGSVGYSTPVCLDVWPEDGRVWNNGTYNVQQEDFVHAELEKLGRSQNWSALCPLPTAPVESDLTRLHAELDALFYRLFGHCCITVWLHTNPTSDRVAQAKWYALCEHIAMHKMLEGRVEVTS